MAEWLVERGIGEIRAVLVDRDGQVLEARLEPDDMLRAGTVIDARLVRRIPARNQGIAVWPDGEALLRPLPIGVTEGATCRIELVRPPMPETGKPKRALARPAPTEALPGPGPDLQQALGIAPLPGSPTPDRLEAAGWSELLDEAASGQVAFPGGKLIISLTPAMTLIDVDGELDAATLAERGAAVAARAIRRLDLGGSIGIDLPTVTDKAARLAAAAAIDAALPQPFERTAINGFGFVQIVRRRTRLSLCELAAADPVGWHARALLRRAARTHGAGERVLAAHPHLIDRIAARPDWIAAVERATGAPLILQAEPRLAISAGHVQPRHP